MARYNMESVDRAIRSARVGKTESRKIHALLAGHEKLAYIIVTDDGIDQICESYLSAKREARDLRAMGRNVRVHTCPWLEQDSVVTAIEESE
jgi:hypothetical protein